MLNKKKDQTSFRLKKLENQEPINLKSNPGPPLTGSTYCVTPLIQNSRLCKLIYSDKKRPVVTWECGKRRCKKEGLQGAQRNFWVIGIFTILIVEMVSWGTTYIKIYQIVHFKCVQFTVYQLCLNRPIKN